MVLSYHTCRTVTRKISMFPAYSPDDLPFEFSPLGTQNPPFVLYQDEKSQTFHAQGKVRLFSMSHFHSQLSGKICFFAPVKENHLISLCQTKETRPHCSLEFSGKGKESSTMSNCNLIMFRASGRSAPADRQAEDPRSVSVQDKACLYDRVIPFGEIATLLKAREDQGNGKT